MSDKDNERVEIRVVHDIPPDECEGAAVENNDAIERQQIEAFWAGRNHAMRRSGRVAA